MKILSMFFRKTFVFGANAPIWVQNDLLSQLLICCKKLFKVYIMESAKRYIKILLMVFPKKSLLWSNWIIFGSKIMHPYNSGLAGTIFGKILLSESGQEVDQNYVNGFSAISSSPGQMHHSGPFTRIWNNLKIFLY